MISIRKKVKLEEISAASMSDLAFLLLIFFMVTAVFFVKEGLNIQLPKKNANNTKVLREQVYEINVIGDTVKMNNKSFGNKTFSSTKEFRMELNKMDVPFIKEKLALIKTSGETKYGNMLDVLSAVQMKGFEKISIKRM